MLIHVYFLRLPFRQRLLISHSLLCYEGYVIGKSNYKNRQRTIRMLSKLKSFTMKVGDVTF